MIKIHDRHARGDTSTSWLDSKHTFSFGSFRDPARMGVGPLRVINDDRVIPGAGFPTHGHKDMEIITYVLGGALAHKDSLGNGSTITAGEIQRMTAGTGITHSEMNASDQDPVHFLQIWVVPEQDGLAPGYEQTRMSPIAGHKSLTKIVGPEGPEGGVKVHQDAHIYVTKPKSGETINIEIAPNRYGFIHLAEGRARLGGEIINAGDGVELKGPVNVTLNAETDAHALVFDVTK